MAKLPRWLRNDGTQTYRTTTHSTFAIDSDSRRARRPSSISDPDEHEFSITVNLGGFSGVSIPWDGTSPEDVRNSFLEFLFNHDEFGIAATEPLRFFRSVRVNFMGKHMLLTFRTSWITGFTVG